jgi:hypothetical protein
MATDAPTGAADGASAPHRLHAVGFAKLNEMEEKSLDMLEAQTKTETNVAHAARSRAKWIRIGLIVTVVSMVLYVLLTITMAPRQFPVLHTWWEDNMSHPDAKPAPRTPAYSISEVVVRSQNGALYTLLNLLGTWKNLSSNGAKFLMFALLRLTATDKDTANPKAVPTAVHWWGSYTDMRSGGQAVTEDMLIGTNGLLCASDLGTFVRKWEASKSWNQWYDFFPHTSSAHFGNVGSVQQLVSPGSAHARDGCEKGEATTSWLYALFTGGMCQVVNLYATPEVSAPDMYARFFLGTPRAEPQCGAAVASGALQGATTAGMTGVGMLGLVGGPIGLAAMGALTVASSVAGGVLGANAAKATCQRHADG